MDHSEFIERHEKGHIDAGELGYYVSHHVATIGEMGELAVSGIFSVSDIVEGRYCEDQEPQATKFMRMVNERMNYKLFVLV